MVITPNHIYFLISYAVAFIAAGLAAKWYLWPAIARRDPKAALTPLLLYACLRVNGLMFLMPGIVSTGLPETFARPVAYGDVTAVLLALCALGALRHGLALAIPAVWIFNIEGTADLLYANVSTFKDHVDPVSLGTAYYLAVINVPVMIVVHVVIFVYLLGHRAHDERERS